MVRNDGKFWKTEKKEAPYSNRGDSCTLVHFVFANVYPFAMLVKKKSNALLRIKNYEILEVRKR